VVRKWADGLPNSGGVVIVSLLGRKPDGVSEFSFYSFYGGFETQADRPGALHFGEWLDRTYPDKRFQLFEHPTIDFKQGASGNTGSIARNDRTILRYGPHRDFCRLRR
jgi:hypothetical protein